MRTQWRVGLEYHFLMKWVAKGDLFLSLLMAGIVVSLVRQEFYVGWQESEQERRLDRSRI
jgi:hypothetical protein